MAEKRIRPIAVAAIRRLSDGKYLVSPIIDAHSKIVAYRFIGGGIEFGEKSDEALCREFMEELGQEIIVGKQIYIKENLFKFGDGFGHEIVFCYEAEFKDKNIYNLDKVPIIESPGNFAIWMDIGLPVRHYAEILG